LKFVKSVSAYIEGSKNFSKFLFFAAERLRIWLILGEQENRRQKTEGRRLALGESALRSDVWAFG